MSPATSFSLPACLRALTRCREMPSRFANAFPFPVSARGVVRFLRMPLSTRALFQLLQALPGRARPWLQLCVVHPLPSEIVQSPGQQLLKVKLGGVAGAPPPKNGAAFEHPISDRAPVESKDLGDL